VKPPLSRLRAAWYGFAVLLAVFTYFYDLGGRHIPTNGDEYPYAQITRLTAASGQLLPLQSRLDHMRNTKPPLLFWQGIASTHSGEHWTLWNLRYPSVIYTLLTASLVFVLARKLSGRWETGALAALVYVAFYNTYRYGRPFLTDPAEVFWLFVPCFVLLYWRSTAFESRLAAPLLLGLAIGVGLLYKSFALLLPVGLALSCWYLGYRDYRVPVFVRRDVAKLAIIAVVSLGVFGLWFWLDPDPRAVWQEFVVGENVGKMEPAEGSYISKLLWGGSSVWSLAFALLMNAGLLAFPIVALIYLAYRGRRELTVEEKFLWIWVIALFVAFSLPSQRSGRYLLPAMPALAVLCALSWDRINRTALVASVVVAGALIALIAWLSVRLQQAMSGVQLYPPGYWVLLASTSLLVLLSLALPSLTRPTVSVVAILFLLSLAVFLGPFDGPLGSYSASAREYAQGKQVWVPCNFRAKEEGHRFLLPGAEIHSYRDDPGLAVADLAARYPLFAAQVPLDAAPSCAECEVIGERLEIRGRHSSEEIKQMLRGNVLPHLFVKEVLFESRQASPPAAPPRVEACG